MADSTTMQLGLFDPRSTPDGCTTDEAPKTAPELGTMRALTLHRPWPWTIAHVPEPLAKRLENRPWRYPKALHGQVIALHAGKHWDAEREPYILRALGIDALPDAARDEGIVGIVRLVDCVGEWAGVMGRLPAEQARWFFGPFGWVLADVRALMEPIPIRGAQGLWRVPLTVQQRIEEEVALG